METNFFKAIAALQLGGDLQITIRQEADKMIVATRLNNKSCDDKAKNLIPPLILNGTPEELDEGYFANTTAPLQTTSQLFVNMDAYMKAQQAAQQQSKMAQLKSVKPNKEIDEKTRKYQAAIKKAEELAGEGRFREAWAKYPEPLDHPDFADQIRSRKAELSQKFVPDLFASAAAENKEPVSLEPDASATNEEERDEEQQLKQSMQVEEGEEFTENGL